MTEDIFSNVDSVILTMERAMRNLIPPQDMLPSQWSQQHISISVGNVIPGKLNFENASYQRGMLDVIKEHGIRRITYMTGAQLRKTTVQQCIAAYFIAHEPRSQIFVQPTQGDVQRSHQRGRPRRALGTARYNLWRHCPVHRIQHANHQRVITCGDSLF